MTLNKVTETDHLRGLSGIGKDKRKDSLERISLDMPFFESLRMGRRGNLSTLYIDGVSVVSYSDVRREHIGKRLDMEEGGLNGSLFFNNGFFKNFNSPHLRKGSDMRNLAKVFFKVNGDNYALLVQYLHPEGESREHYHTLEESLVQLAGRSFLELRPLLDDTSLKTIELSPGDIYRIPSETLHTVKTAFDVGSITVPIKQTVKRRKDHFYAEKSEKRMNLEIEDLLGSRYNSGNEMLSSLFLYSEGLSEDEREVFKNCLGQRIESEGNPNISEVIREFMKY